MRRPRPVLLLIVYGVFLVIVGVTASAQVMLASLHVSTSALNQAVTADTQIVRGFVDDLLVPADLEAPGPDVRRLATLQAGLQAFVAPRGILRAEIRRPDGTIVASDAPIAGFRAAGSPDWATAIAGQTAVGITAAAVSEAGPGELGAETMVREYLPLLRDGQVAGVVAVWRDAAPIMAAIDAARRDVVLVTVSAAVAAAIVLYLVFRSAQARITRQTVALLEATRRDPFTGMLNHGELVDLVEAAIERLRGTGEGLEIALLDIDNFRILNDTWGHAAGDDAISAVGDRLRPLAASSLAVGRYGPDEFLVAVEGPAVGTLLRTMEQVQRDLAEVRLRFGDSQDLPVTISGAIARFPDDGDSVTELFANAAVTLREAKAGGGGAVLVTAFDVDATVLSGSFDVFQGLILAVDAKDRYTKRHSEDVARYAMFIATKSGLGAEELDTLRLAGLLHDVGKVGIPDQILRKPGKLTDAEFDIVKQHVALGDAILRDLPDLDTIRAGVRHHHERWDGRGYLHALAGEDIPLFARILAVADTFSAMTTSRPYRKALDLREARMRLEDAAGSQLDERLVKAFLDGIESDANPPLPGDDVAARLWLPNTRVA
ncbi:MAG TPA: diguanylate cyclase [Candidatus Limnocylindrales bacterium]